MSALHLFAYTNARFQQRFNTSMLIWPQEGRTALVEKLRA